MLFLLPDASFGANLLKISEGGGFQSLGAIVFTLMTTWRTGRDLLHELAEKSEPWTIFEVIAEDPPARLRGTAVFMVRRLHGSPRCWSPSQTP
jgi:KUP system potassium uptake protein